MIACRANVIISILALYFQARPISFRLILGAPIFISSSDYTSDLNLLILKINHFLRLRDSIFLSILIKVALIFWLFLLFFSIFKHHIFFIFSFYLSSTVRSSFYILTVSCYSFLSFIDIITYFFVFGLLFF